MIPRKKIQVFVSSTYEDLKEERQAAVEAILRAKHIPAGMELFAAGDQSQMQTIRQWIDESDVFLLILGGRYGTIEEESQKSYIQLEYEYALAKGKSYFAVAITEEAIDKKVAKMGKKAIEQKHPVKLESFRKTVCSKVVRYWNDLNEIKLAILEKLPELSDDENLIGWIPGDQAINSGPVAEEIARLAKENASLQDRLFQAQSSERFTGLTFDEMLTVLRAKMLVDVLWDQQGLLQGGAGHNSPHTTSFEGLAMFGLVTQHPTAGYALTDDGRRFFAAAKVH